MSRAVVLPRPYSLLRSRAIDVSRRKTFELSRVSWQPSASMHSLVVGKPILSITRFVAVLSEYTIIKRMASRSEIFVPGEKCVVQHAGAGHLVVFLEFDHRRRATACLRQPLRRWRSSRAT